MVVLIVDNRAGVPDETLTAAQETARRIYEAAGVRLIWVDAGSPKPDVPAALHLTLSLPSRAGEERLLADKRIRKTVLGVAPPETARVYVFPARISRLAASAGKPYDTVLGRVFAHEIGHQLLPGQGHSETGIMQAKLDYRSQQPGFTEREAHSIRMLLMASK